MIKDILGNELQPGDIVVYSDRWPKGTGIYFGMIRHLTASGKLAISMRDYEYVPGDPSKRKLGQYQWLEPISFKRYITNYRWPATVLKYEKINISD